MSLHKSQILILSCLIYLLSVFVYCVFFYQINYSALPSGKTIFQGKIIQEPDLREDYQNLIVQDSQGENILVKADRYPEYAYGDLLEITCALNRPENFSGFNYQTYLAVQNIYTVCKEPKIERLAQHQGNAILETIFNLKRNLQDLCERIWTTPVTDFMQGILLGVKKGLPEDLEQDFKNSGTFHILVVSGSHLVLLAGFLKIILKIFLVPRKKQFYVIALVLSGYIILTGLSAASLRALLLSLVVMLAEKFGRPKNIFNVLVFTATLMVLQNYLILVYDVGFQLSFSATCGLVYLSPKIETWFKWLPNYLGLRSSLAQTLGAIILTTPITYFNFGRLSYVAPLANLLTAPLISPLMLSGALALLLGAFYPPLGILLGQGVGILVKIVVYINHYLAQF